MDRGTVLCQVLAHQLYGLEKKNRLQQATLRW